MESLSQAEVGSALQVFFNLQELPKVSIPVILASYSVQRWMRHCSAANICQRLHNRMLFA